MTKADNCLALFAIAYAMLKLLPEIILMIDGILNLVKGAFRLAG